MDAFIRNLKETRKLNNLSQRQVADYLGITQPSYIRYGTFVGKPC